MYSKKISLSAAIMSIVLLTGTASFGQSLDEIRNNIRAKGQKWIADETSISILPDNEKKRRLGLIKHAPTGKEKVLAAQEEPQTGLPVFVDWTNYASEVRDQKSCGSCWAFAATAALESNILIRENRPFGLDNRAEQILVSCSGAGSCDGGYIGSASGYIQSTGLPPEGDFAYSATNNSCGNAEDGWQDRVAKIGSWSYVNTAPANLTAIKNALAAYGPLITTMDVYNDFFSYRGGIYEYSGGSYQGGHAILIVGYTDDSSRPDGGYFKVKNSWGTWWGSQGYFLIGYSQIGSPVYFGEWTIAYSTPILPPAPGAPTSLSASPVSGSQINLTWADNSSNETGFKVERCTGSGCSSFSHIATLGASVLSYNNTGLTGSTSYSYRVRSYNSGGDSGYSNTASATTQAAQPPAAPSALTATAASTSQINLHWTDNSNNETGFKIERCIGAGCSNFSQIATVAANATAYNSSGLAASTTYTYRIRAYLTGADSGYSNISSATTLCSCTISPTSRTFPAAGGSGSVTVTSPAGCAWTVSSNTSWIVNLSPSSGSGNGTVSYSVPKNTTRVRRTETINIGGKTHSVTQAKK
jgi:C1A family cysteine protease